ncbi:MAG TPA: ABC transporter permease [Thermodesulfobacteriota bacterium]
MRLWITRGILAVAFVLAWEAAGLWVIDPFFISRPSLVAAVLVEWTLNGRLIHHTWITVQEMLLGLALGSLVGIVVGLALGLRPGLARLLDPFVMGAYALPKVALGPLFILWFGIGITMKIMLSAVIVFFLVFFNTLAGVRAVDRSLVAVIRMMGATRAQVVRKVVIPSALVWIFLGLRVSVPYALIGAVVGEIIASNRGLGFLLSSAAGYLDTPGLFAALIALMVLAILVNGGVDLLERRFLKWRPAEAAGDGGGL